MIHIASNNLFINHPQLTRETGLSGGNTFSFCRFHVLVPFSSPNFAKLVEHVWKLVGATGAINLKPLFKSEPGVFEATSRSRPLSEDSIPEQTKSWKNHFHNKHWPAYFFYAYYTT